MLTASRIIPRSGGFGVSLGLCYSIEDIMSDIILFCTTASLPTRLRTEAKQDLQLLTV